MQEDLAFMHRALEEARKALEHDDIPVGAVLVKEGKIIATGRNQREQLLSPSAHAEIQALNQGAKAMGHWNLSGTKLYVTLEPCVMCAGALVLARIDEVIYAAEDPKGGAIQLNIPILNNPKLNHQVTFRKGPLAQECGDILKKFFQEKRKQKKTS